MSHSYIIKELLYINFNFYEDYFERRKKQSSNES
ncbi:hypothetical protein M2139_002634 [Enterococcus sp. PF1-24]|nr:hypothetical protein [Enterococcus sp. PFB1-1]MDH6402728.1 hypothetical protein [Enterococcus sp. PF1-24]